MKKAIEVVATSLGTAVGCLIIFILPSAWIITFLYLYVRRGYSFWTACLWSVVADAVVVPVTLLLMAVMALPFYLLAEWRRKRRQDGGLIDEP